MTPEQAAHETAAAIGSVPARFMNDAATYVRGAELGFEGADFYVAGRGGTLGEVAADVVTAAFVFFAPETVRAAWERSGAVMSRADAVRAWLDIGYGFARENYSDDVDWARVAELAGRIAAAAPVAGAPLFAAWRTLPEPTDPKALASHHLNALRELRGALHGAAVLTVGLTPHEAVAVRAPELGAIFGWPDPMPDAAPLRERWQLAEARTDRMLGRHYRTLTEQERQEFVDLLQLA
jgi:hypothetical protein